MVCYGRQSPDIAQGVDRASDDYLNQGAGDQGLMFGYACDETPSLMPFPIYYAHRLVQRQSEVRRDGRLPWLRPDAKSQVTVRYVDGKPIGDRHRRAVDAASSEHERQAEGARRGGDRGDHQAGAAAATCSTARAILVNPTGRFEIGGPHGDAGLTGRKIIVDTYGGAAPHGGGAFSGKDPSKVDRSAAYAARYVAKNIVAAGIARQCQVQVSYAIGVAQADQRDRLHRGHGHDPRRADRGSSSTRTSTCGRRASSGCSTCCGRSICKTAAYGHFGRDEPEFTWEATDKVEVLRAAAGLRTAVAAD